MHFQGLQTQQRFFIRQKVTLMVNRYVVTVASPDGSEGEVVAFAQQKRRALKEEITFYADDSKKEVLFTLKARQVIDLGATFDVNDPAGEPLGQFRKNFAASLLRSTWHMAQPGLPEATGQERNRFVAALRRLWRLVPVTDTLPFAWPYHFDFAVDGQPVMSVDKKFGLRDRYVLQITAPETDRRLAFAQAVGLDALQSR